MRSKSLQLKPISKQVIRGAMMFIEIKEMIKRNSENSFLFCGSFAIKPIGFHAEPLYAVKILAQF